MRDDLGLHEGERFDALRAVLRLLPTPSGPFPKRERWLALFKATLDYTYDVEPDPLVCPLCGGPKGRYATACIKHNGGTPGNPGGPGGDRSSPAAITAGVGGERKGVVEIDARTLPTEQRQDLSAALATKNGVDVARALKPALVPGTGLGRFPVRRGRPPKLAGPGFERCPKCGNGKLIMKDCSRCRDLSEFVPTGERIQIR